MAERDTLYRPNRRVILFLGPTRAECPKGSGARSALEGRTEGFVLEPNLDGYRASAVRRFLHEREGIFLKAGAASSSRA